MIRRKYAKILTVIASGSCPYELLFSPYFLPFLTFPIFYRKLQYVNNQGKDKLKKKKQYLNM